MPDESPAEQVSVNAATAIKSILGDFASHVPHNGSLSGQQRWGEHLRLDEPGSWRGRLITHEAVSRLVMPLVARAEFQVGPDGSPAIASALEKAARFLSETPGGVSKDRASEIRTLVAADSILSHVEYLIDRRWEPIPGESLVALSGELDTLRDVIDTAIADGQLNVLLATPLLDAVVWAERATDLSNRFEALIGLGSAVHDVAAAAHDLVVVVAADQGGSSSVPEWLTDVALTGVALDGFAVQIHSVGFVPEWVAQGPGQLSSVVAALILAKRRDFAQEALKRWRALVKALHPDPALPPGVTPELRAGEDAAG